MWAAWTVAKKAYLLVGARAEKWDTSGAGSWVVSWDVDEAVARAGM